MQKSSKDRIVMFKKPPYEMAGDYITSRQLTRTIPKLYNCGDDIYQNNISVSCCLARQRLMKTEKLLDIKRDIALKKRVLLDKQWIDIIQKEESLRQMFVDFNQFVIDNVDKRVRASQKIESEEALYIKRYNDICELKKKCEELQELKQKMVDHTRVFKIYEDFLNNVVLEYPAEFNNIIDVLQRYELILTTGIELTAAHMATSELLENIKHEFDKTVDRYLIIISGLHTKVAQLQQRHESAKRDCHRWEEMYERLRAKATDQITDVICVKDSCWRIYEDICKRKGVRPVHKGDYEKQLEVIKKALRDYRNINELARKYAKEELLASERACVSKGDA